MTKLISTFCVLFSLCVNISFSQNSVNTTGNDVDGSNGSVSYSIGQTFTQTHSNNSYSSSTGIHQPFEISIVSSISETSIFNLTIFPNPTANELTLATDVLEDNDMSYRMIAMDGKTILSGEINDVSTKLSLENLANATYILGIYKNNQAIESYKIIKHK